MEQPTRRVEPKKVDHVMITNIKENNQVNDVITNELTFYSNSSLPQNPIKEP